MPLPPSQTRACNSALAHLGESRRIASIGDGTPLAKVFLAIWDEAVDEVLADHPWNRAIARADLAADADYVPAGTQYAQAFEKPDDCVRWLPWRRGHEDYFDGEEEGDFILSNCAAPLPFRYIRRLDDISKWSAGMYACLTVMLAWKSAKAITGQGSMIDRMAARYEKVSSDAKRQDGSATGERQRFLDVQSSWLAARNRTSRGVTFR